MFNTKVSGHRKFEKALPPNAPVATGLLGPRRNLYVY